MDVAVEGTGCELFGTESSPVDVGDGAGMSVQHEIDSVFGGEIEIPDEGFKV
jgi:hypothetical protein